MENGKVYLTLQNGKQFVGTRFGAGGDVIGELVFTTGMTGYVETLTDPSYYGQIVTQTFPLIGNYGVTPDFESKRPWVSAYIVREKCDAPSNFRCEETLDKYLKDNGIIGVYGVDTRELTKIVRESGVMNAAITSKPVTDFSAIKSYVIRDAVKSVTCKQPEYYGDPDGLKGIDGAKYARVQPGWSRTELVRGQYDFTWLDRTVDKLLAGGIQPWLNLGYGNMLYTDAPAPDACGWDSPVSGSFTCCLCCCRSLTGSTRKYVWSWRRPAQRKSMRCWRRASWI